MDHNPLETREENSNKAQAGVPEYLPGEPVLPKPTAMFFVCQIIGGMAGFVLLAMITAPFWSFYWLGALVWGSPPNVPKLWQVRRYLRLTWTSRYPAPRLPFGKRCLLTISILRKVVLAPVLGLAWFCDELLFGRVLDSTPVVAPRWVSTTVSVPVPRLRSALRASFLAKVRNITAFKSMGYEPV